MKNQQERAKATKVSATFSPKPLYPVALRGGRIVHMMEGSQERKQVEHDKGGKKEGAVLKKRRSINRTENDGLDHFL
jgi:hypothetical protein